MYLSKLELHGFKSFADRTSIQFAPGITVVVGPNGCGKSNIVDAVRWVIGEQRARILRSEKMDNVIFNGTTTRRALGLSEVMLTIENTRGILPTEFSEVTIGRRLYRSGESEYLLNGVSCRLKDITDLFMDTGMGAGAYSVIELKMIEDLLSENAQDRRHLFEEAAGITKYKVRRAQTLRKLDGTQADLTRVRDLTEELAGRVRSLERQAQKAARWKTHRDRLRVVELALARLEYDRLAEGRQELDRERRLLGDSLEEAGAALAQAEALYEAHRTEHIGREQTLVAAQSALAAHLDVFRKKESDERVARERLTAMERDLARLAHESDMAGQRKSVLEESLVNLTSELEAAGPASQVADDLLQEAQRARDVAARCVDEQRAALERARTSERMAVERLAEARRAIDRTVARLDMLQDETARLNGQMGPARDAVTEAVRNAADAAERVEAARAQRDAAGTRLEEALAERAGRAARLEALLDTLRDAERRHDAHATEAALLGSLLSSFDEFAEPVQFLAGEPDWADDDLRTAADLCGCDEQHRAAVEAALGEFAGCLVVHSEAEAARAISRLRSAGKGRATFLVLDRIPETLVGPAAPPPGAQSLSELVRVPDPAYRSLVSILLRDSFLVDDLDTALTLARGGSERSRYFASTGEWVSPTGLLHAGSEQAGASPAAGRIGRREQFAEAVRSRDAAAENVRLAGESAADARAAVEALDVSELEDRLRSAEGVLRTAENQEVRSRVEADDAGRRLRELEARLAQLTASCEGSQEDISARSSSLADAEADSEARSRGRAALEDEFARVDAEGKAALGRYSDARVAAMQARNRLENAERELAHTVEGLAQLERQQTERDGLVERIAADRLETRSLMDALTAERATLQAESTRLERAVSDAKDHMSEARVVISELEARLRELRRSREHLQRDEHLLAVRETELKTRAEDLIAATRLEFEVDLSTEPVDLPEDLDPDEARAEALDLRAKLRNLGPVNELALESFEEERARLEFLQAQLRDLEGAEATLLETIREINTTASDRFMESFEAIRANFSRIFAQLFGEEATADIVLEIPDDPLESAIEIMAKPTGKRPSVLAQLSGGEKTLTAIALLFAIYLVKPSPFCILDEVDAPLDDANIARFMSLIRSFADSTQFVLVTHNKRTMEAADRMYGITMQEQGVSRLVGVRFDAELQRVA